MYDQLRGRTNSTSKISQYEYAALRSGGKHTDANIWLLSRAVHRYLRDPLNPVLDRIRDVRDDLDRLAQVIPSALFLLRGVSNQQLTSARGHEGGGGAVQ